MHNWDDFYNEPSEFEQQVEELKQLLMETVKDEFKTEMERLRKENEELHDVKKNFDQIKREYKAKEREFEIKMQNAERKAKLARLAELMKEYEVVMYSARRMRKNGPKCDKCNEHRKIEFTSPSGRLMQEDCACAAPIIWYEPLQHILHEFRYDTEMTVWYKPYKNSDEGFTFYSSKVARCVYEKGMDYEQLDSYNTLFKNKEDCQAYCDWLTEKETEED